MWVGCDRLVYPFAHIVKLLMLTAQRRDEVASLRWIEVELESRVWSMPAHRTKAGRAHVVPLAAAAIEILRSVPRIHDVLVFPGRGTDQPASGFSKWKRELDRASGVSDWTLHDLRRTAATNMAKLKVPPHVVERILNHSSGALGGVAGIYNRFGYLPEMREALEKWAQHLVHLVRTAGGDVATGRDMSERDAASLVL